MVRNNSEAFVSAIFLTFAGNCKSALTFYQSVFGGRLDIHTFNSVLPGIEAKPVISASLVSDRVVIHGSDLVPDEGRQTGNHMSVFLCCNDIDDRRGLVERLGGSVSVYDCDVLAEVVDRFGVRWVLGVASF